MTAAFADLAFADPALRRLVRSFWSLSYGADQDGMPGVIAPDAHVEFVFQTGEPCNLLAGDAVHAAPRAMIFAQRHGTVSLAPTGANGIIAFRTLPAVASSILGRPLVDCWDRPVPLAEMIGADADRLLGRLARAPVAGRAALLETWLTSRLSNWTAETMRNARLQRTLLWRAGGEKLSVWTGGLAMSERTLRRQFEKHAGLSPKQLAMSGRILRACAALSDGGIPIAHIALDVGFGDQPAFTNAFRHYVGTTPAALRAEPLVYCERGG